MFASFAASLKMACPAAYEGLLEGNEFEVESQAAVELVRGSDCSAYDCEFIALAKQLGSGLVAMDKKLLKAFPKRALALSGS